MTLFKDDTVKCTKRRLTLLFMLNVSDWICTLSLLSTGYFKEANPIMRNVVESISLGFAVKILLPLGLILLAVKKVSNAEPRQILIANNIILAGVSIYTLLNLYHLFCFSILIFYLR